MLPFIQIFVDQVLPKVLTLLLAELVSGAFFRKAIHAALSFVEILLIKTLISDDIFVSLLLQRRQLCCARQVVVHERAIGDVLRNLNLIVNRILHPLGRLACGRRVAGCFLRITLEQATHYAAPFMYASGLLALGLNLPRANVFPLCLRS